MNLNLIKVKQQEAYIPAKVYFKCCFRVFYAAFHANNQFRYHAGLILFSLGKKIYNFVLA